MVIDALTGLREVLLGPDRAPARQHSGALLWPVLAITVAGYVLTGLASVQIDVAPPLVRAALAVAAAGPLALVHSSPLLAWRLAALATLVTAPAEVAPDGLTWPWHPVQLLILPGTLLAVALRHRPAIVAWAALLSCAAMLPRVPPQDAATVIVALTIVALTGVQVRRRVTARQTAEQTRRALREQRTRIARELHDVVGHHMSLIAVRAESAPYRLHSTPEAQEAEFTAIAGASRDALHDMRRLVGTLRTDAGPRGNARKPPRHDAEPLGIGDVRTLIDRATAAGLTVVANLDPAAERAAIPAGPALAVHRIVQESLSNAARHAPGSTVYVSIEVGGCAARSSRTGPGHDRIRVGVRNTAPACPGSAVPDSGPAGGNGLIGMRERVSALHGTLSAGATRDRGYRVDAVIPLSPARRRRWFPGKTVDRPGEAPLRAPVPPGPCRSAASPG